MSNTKRPHSAQSKPKDAHDANSLIATGKTYQARLQELGLQELPANPTTRRPSPHQIAVMAAILARHDESVRPVDLVDNALQLWDAAVNHAGIAETASKMVRGLYVYNQTDWISLGSALITEIDGRKSFTSQDTLQARLEAASRHAGLAVMQCWKQSGQKLHPLKELFPAMSETEHTRAEKMIKLMQFTRDEVRKRDQNAQDLPFECEPRAEDLREAILEAWKPLWLSKEEEPELSIAVDAAGFLMRNPDKAIVVLFRLPLLARWVAVMKQEFASAAKRRNSNPGRRAPSKRRGKT